MTSLRVAVETETGTKEYPVTPRVEVDFERHWNVGIGKAFNDMRKEHVFHLAWLAVKASGETVKPFDGWLDTILSADILVEQDRPSTATA